MSLLKIGIAASLALVAFAGNSVLCRLALSDKSIDAGSFTSIRLLSGAIVLALILLANRSKPSTAAKGSWIGASMLFIYAATFSYAYITLDTGIGALILFGTVQVTMVVVSLVTGNRHHFLEWMGMIVAFLGFVYLVLPSLSDPSLLGFILMCVAGISWGFYTLMGRSSLSPLSDTGYNFLRTLPLCLALLILLVLIGDVRISPRGILFAMLSGAVASGLGYTLWYLALGGLSSTQAAVLQLFVPVLAAIGGVVFANEPISARLVISSFAVLGGVLIVVWGRYYFLLSRPSQSGESSL